jgi:hypothetical protein
MWRTDLWWGLRVTVPGIGSGADQLRGSTKKPWLLSICCSSAHARSASDTMVDIVSVMCECQLDDFCINGVFNEVSMVRYACMLQVRVHILTTSWPFGPSLAFSTICDRPGTAQRSLDAAEKAHGTTTLDMGHWSHFLLATALSVCIIESSSTAINQQ